MTAQEFLERIRDIKPGIGARAEACEKLRRIPDETWKDLTEAGMWRALKPKAWGGFELEPLVVYRAQMEIAEVCPSTSWVMGVVGVHDWMMGCFPVEAQRDLWGEGREAQICSALAPTGKVERAPGGFRISGRFPFSSGSHHCTWAVLGGVAKADGKAPVSLAFLLPRSDYQIDDVWHVAGLAGTGSNDIVVDRAFVPEHRTNRFIEIQPRHARPLYRLPFGGIFNSGIAAPALGAAQGTLEIFRSQTRQRRAAYDGARIAEDPFAQHTLAQATGMIDGARLRFERSWSEIWPCAEAGRELPMALRRRLRFDANQAVAASIHAVDLLFAASGGKAIFLDNPMQRMFRDVHAMRAHAMNNGEKVSRMFGRFDLDPNAPIAEPGETLV
jgi:3-hydroxy-9,10-secoandrosta-1,3,5(10)-triene-9,17-dione monooxygenase